MYVKPAIKGTGSINAGISLLKEFDIQKVIIRVRKPHAPINADFKNVEVELLRFKWLKEIKYIFLLDQILEIENQILLKQYNQTKFLGKITI